MDELCAWIMEFDNDPTPTRAAVMLPAVASELASRKSVASLADCATWDSSITALETFANMLGEAI